MRIEIDQEAVTPEQVSYRELGFGEKSSGFLFAQYRLVYGIDEVVESLRSPYAVWIEDQKRDDEAAGEPYPEYFLELGYPPFDEFVKHPTPLCDAVKDFFYNDLLSSSLAPASDDKVRWIINSIDSISADNKQLAIVGTAFQKVQVHER
jgi:hypothetical protein